MAYNGDAPRIKRERNDSDGMMRNHRGGGGEFYGDEPARKRQKPFGSGEDNSKSFRSSNDHERPNHVLLFTILNPVYPITTEVIHTICSPSGNVQRIVIFKKNGVQAMVEFANVEEAKRAKETLQGADIYSGCCTLKIDFAKPTKLNVYKNDSESWDYTSPSMGKGESGGRSQPLLAAPRYGAGPQPYGDSRGGGGGGGGGGSGSMRGSAPYNQGGGNMTDRFDDNYQNGPGHMGGGGGGGGGGGFGGGDPYGERYGGGRDTMYNQRGPGGPGGPGNNTSMNAGLMGSSAPQHSPVLMAYNLPMNKINCDKIFNLLCLYGNVSKVKFLKTKEGCAMVMMGDALAVERTITNLNGTPLKDGGKLELGYSKQAFLADVPNPYQLPDNSPSFKDFSGSKNNRFMNPAMASKNRIQTPSKILHFFNTPPNATEEQFYQVFEDCGVSRPKSIKIFQGKSERSSAGLVEFEDVKDAVDALMNCNHHPIDNPGGKFPYNMKLCFSSARSMREPRERDGRDGKDDD